jgi:hypothetical protein
LRPSQLTRPVEGDTGDRKQDSDLISLVGLAESRRVSVRRIRTAQLGNRDKRAPRRASSPKPAVSGSDSPDPNRQNPAKPRDFLGLRLSLMGESLLAQTQWRWGESGANSSLRVDPCFAGKIQGKLPQFGPPGRASTKKSRGFPKAWRRFPCDQEQGIYPREQGIGFKEQGNPPGKAADELRRSSHPAGPYEER